MKNVNRRKPFAGDAKHRLPSGKIEPYRLWYSFLKLALQDKDLNVDKRFYRAWGNVKSTNFKDWWQPNWRTLFAAPLDVIEINHQQVANTVYSANRVLISVNLRTPIDKSLSQIRDVLRAKKVNLSRKKQIPNGGHFTLSGKTEIKRVSVQQALKVYELYLRNPDPLDIATEYVQWADSWNSKIEANNWKRPKIYPPQYLREFCKKRSQSDPPSDESRRSVRRLIQRSRKIAANVAKGEFPGAY